MMIGRTHTKMQELLSIPNHSMYVLPPRLQSRRG